MGRIPYHKVHSVATYRQLIFVCTFLSHSSLYYSVLMQTDQPLLSNLGQVCSQDRFCRVGRTLITTSSSSFPSSVILGYHMHRDQALPPLAKLTNRFLPRSSATAHMAFGTELRLPRNIGINEAFDQMVSKSIEIVAGDTIL